MGKRSNRHFWQRLNSTALLRSLIVLLLLFCCGCATVFLIHYFYSVIVIFVISATLAALLNYPVHWLTRYVPHGVAIAIVCLTTVGLFAGLVTALGLEVVTQGQELATSLVNLFQATDLTPFQKFLSAIDIGKIVETVQTGLLSGVGLLQTAFSNFLAVIFIAVICVYMLIDGNRIWLACLQLVPVDARDRFAITLQRSFLGFFRAQFLLVLFLSLSCLIAFSVLGVKYALFLCLILGLIDAVPGIGGTLCAIVVTLLVLLSQEWWMALKVLITCTVLQQIQDNLIAPRLMKNQLDINPVFLFFALFIGERVAGLLGVFLSIPIAAMIVSWLHQPVKQAELASPDS